jgi:small-conductance mechanosensitive channel
VTIAEPLTSAEDESLESEIGQTIPKLGRAGASFRRKESGDEVSAQHLGNLLRQLSNPPMSEIANLISELQTLRKKLQTDGDRIQRDIAEHAELSQQVMQLTTIISDSVKKLLRASGINR